MVGRVFLADIMKSHMTESSNISDVVEKVAGRTIGERENITPMLEWARQNPERVQALLASFDGLVQRLNVMLAGDVLSHLTNVIALKEKLGGNLLPTQEDMNQDGIARFTSFVRGMKTMSDMMARGETTKDKPYLRFHTTTTDSEALAVGAIFHGYEEMMARHSELGAFFANDQLVNALIEVIDFSDELFPALSEKGKLDWIDGYDGFSLQFRNEKGLS